MGLAAAPGLIMSVISSPDTLSCSLWSPPESHDNNRKCVIVTSSFSGSLTTPIYPHSSEQLAAYWATSTLSILAGSWWTKSGWVSVTSAYALKDYSKWSIKGCLILIFSEQIPLINQPWQGRQEFLKGNNFHQTWDPGIVFICLVRLSNWNPLPPQPWWNIIRPRSIDSPTECSMEMMEIGWMTAKLCNIDSLSPIRKGRGNILWKWWCVLMGYGQKLGRNQTTIWIH